MRPRRRGNKKKMWRWRREGGKGEISIRVCTRRGRVLLAHISFALLRRVPGRHYRATRIFTILHFSFEHSNIMISLTKQRGADVKR